MIGLAGGGFLLSSFATENAFCFFVSAIGILAGWGLAASKSRVVRAIRIDHRCVWLKWVAPEFLAVLPDWRN